MNVDSKEAFQNLIPNNQCFGCGPNNKDGLQIKSYWSKPGESICPFEPAPHHMAGAKQSAPLLTATVFVQQWLLAMRQRIVRLELVTRDGLRQDRLP